MRRLAALVLALSLIASPAIAAPETLPAAGQFWSRLGGWLFGLASFSAYTAPPSGDETNSPHGDQAEFATDPDGGTHNTDTGPMIDPNG